jgi:CheY-like chemotaxis protein
MINRHYITADGRQKRMALRFAIPAALLLLLFGATAEAQNFATTYSYKSPNTYSTTSHVTGGTATHAPGLPQSAWRSKVKRPKSRYMPYIRNYTKFSGYFGAYGGGPASTTAPTTETDAADIGRGRGETVMVVDHESYLRLRVASALRKLGYNVLEASDGKIALQMLRADPTVSVLMTEIGFPSGPSGPRIAKTARKLNPNIKLLYVAGYVGRKLPQSEIDAQIVRKPYHMAEVAGKVRSMIDGTLR